jgi:hypothetical protein
VTPTCSRYIDALTKPKATFAAKVEALSSGLSSMALAHANIAPALIAILDVAADDNARMAHKQNASAHGTTAIRVEALLKCDARQQANMAALQAALNTATAAVATTNANAAAAHAIAAAANAYVFKPATPPRFVNKDNDMDVRKWLHDVEKYARTCSDGEFLHVVSSFLHGKPRSYF